MELWMKNPFAMIHADAVLQTELEVKANQQRLGQQLLIMWALEIL